MWPPTALTAVRSLTVFAVSYNLIIFLQVTIDNVADFFPWDTECIIISVCLGFFIFQSFAAAWLDG